MYYYEKLLLLSMLCVSPARTRFVSRFPPAASPNGICGKSNKATGIKYRLGVWMWCAVGRIRDALSDWLTEISQISTQQVDGAGWRSDSATCLVYSFPRTNGKRQSRCKTDEQVRRGCEENLLFSQPVRPRTFINKWFGRQVTEILPSLSLDSYHTRSLQSQDCPLVFFTSSSTDAFLSIQLRRRVIMQTAPQQRSLHTKLRRTQVTSRSARNLFANYPTTRSNLSFSALIPVAYSSKAAAATSTQTAVSLFIYKLQPMQQQSATNALTLKTF